MTSPSSKTVPLNIFYSYAHKDEKSRAELSKHLAPFRRAGSIKEWYDGDIEAGEEFERAINENIYDADIILLIISVNFVNSDYCWEKEMSVALKLHDSSSAQVIPVMLNPISVPISAMPFGKIKVLPKDGKPVSHWETQSDGWNDVATTIGGIIEHLNNSKKKPKEKHGAAISSSAKTNAKPSKKSAKLATRKTARQDNLPVAALRIKGSLNKINRVIYDAQHLELIPGKIIRQEGTAPVKDKIANEVYNNLGMVYDFFNNVYGRHSVDNKGMPLRVVIHFGKNFRNIFWDGRNIVIGDGDDIMKNFHEKEFLAHDFTFAMIQYESGLEYWGESGSLMVASGHIFGCLCRQYYNKENARQASWVFGENSLSGRGIRRGLFSISDPGTAYVGHPQIGTDQNKFHILDMMVVDKKNDKSAIDQGGVHINCGIPSRAFYLASIMIGGNAWEIAGRIWYETLLSKDLSKAPDFADFARLSSDIAERLYGKGSIPALAFQRGWALVGVDLTKKSKKKQVKRT